MIWTRPNAALVVPFLFLCKEVQKKQLFAGLSIGAAFFVGLTLLLNHQSYWFDFYLTCKEWVRNNSAGLITYTCNKFVTVEDKVVILPPGHPRVYWQTQIVNIYHFVWGIFHFLIPVIYLTIAFVTAYAAGLWYSFKGKANTFSRALLLGILLYWFSEIMAPILKVSYHYIELFPVVLLFAGGYKDLLLREKVLLAASLVFTFLPFIPMNLGIAEFCTVACLVSCLLRRSFLKTAALS